jgi:hypothetical protein
MLLRYGVMITYRATSRLALMLAMAIIPIIASGCAQNVSVRTATNPAASFDHYRTFSFGPAEGPPRGYQPSSRSPEVQRLLEPLITAGLTQRGYASASGKGDLFIDYGFGRRAVVVHETSETPTASWLPDDENATFVEGSLVIDAYDASTGVRVWHGASRDQIDSSHIDNDLLQRSVKELMAAFPTLQVSSDRQAVTRSAGR